MGARAPDGESTRHRVSRATRLSHPCASSGRRCACSRRLRRRTTLSAGLPGATCFSVYRRRPRCPSGRRLHSSIRRERHTVVHRDPPALRVSQQAHAAPSALSGAAVCVLLSVVRELTTCCSRSPSSTARWPSAWRSRGCERGRGTRDRAWCHGACVCSVWRWPRDLADPLARCATALPMPTPHPLTCASSFAMALTM